jgi:hypothetical protein
MKLPPGQIQEIDIPELRETFADSLGMTIFDGMTARITFCVQRLQQPLPPDPPQVKKYPSARMVLTPEAAVDLFNQMQMIIGAMQQAGLIKIQDGKPVATGTKH